MTDADEQRHQRLARQLEDHAPDVRCPAHPLALVAERITEQAVCAPDAHEWLDLPGAPAADWRECRRCGLADVTLADLGEPVTTE